MPANLIPFTAIGFWIARLSNLSPRLLCLASSGPIKTARFRTCSADFGAANPSSAATSFGKSCLSSNRASEAEAPERRQDFAAAACTREWESCRAELGCREFLALEFALAAAGGQVVNTDCDKLTAGRIDNRFQSPGRLGFIHAADSNLVVNTPRGCRGRVDSKVAGEEIPYLDIFGRGGRCNRDRKNVFVGAALCRKARRQKSKEKTKKKSKPTHYHFFRLPGLGHCPTIAKV